MTHNQAASAASPSVSHQTSERTRPHVVAELNGDAVVFWAGEDGVPTGASRARGFLPRRTYPIAVMAADGSITRITSDPLPNSTLLDHHLARLNPQVPLTLTEVDNLFGDDAVVAVDVSGSVAAVGAFAWADHFRSRGVEVLLFDLSRVASYDGTPHFGGGSGYDELARHLEGREVYPRQVFVVTDGFAPHVTPARPKRWTWLVTPEGDDWMRTANTPMRAYRIADRPA